MKTQILTTCGYRIAMLVGFLIGYPTYAVSNDNHLFFSASYSLQDKQQKGIIKLSGTVKDAQGVLGGVIVSVENKTVATDLDGKYTIDIAVGDRITFSMLGYKERSMVYSSSMGSVLNIELLEDNTTLEEIVVNAGYYTVKDRERTGSIARVTAKEIEKNPVTNLIGSMQGKMSGVQITQKSGVPGGGYSIKIRGTNSLRASANNPLYIVDGLPILSDNISNVQISAAAIPEGIINPLNSLNPNDIESIEILKDADATAIYGSRGANGVVLITTKKNKNQHLQISINSKTGIGKAIHTMKLMNTEQYLSMRKQAFINDGLEQYPKEAYDINGTWDTNRYTNWRKELLGQTAFYNNIQTSISSGTETTSFLISTSYQDETSVFKADTKYKSLNFQSNISHKSKDNRFELNSSVIYSIANNKLPANDLTKAAYTLAPNAPKLYNNDGSLNWANNTWNNPLAQNNSMYKQSNKNFILTNNINYKFIPSLAAKVNIGYTTYNIDEIRTLPSTMYNPNLGRTSSTSSLNLNQGSTNSWLIEPQLDWQYSSDKSFFNILLGATFQNQNTNLLYLNGTNFPSNSLIENISAANTITTRSHILNQYKYQAFYGRINYSYDGTYILNLTGRRDGSSRFGNNNRFANFAAIGGAWLFSKEDFIQNIPWISFGKIRFSYGTTGSDQIGDYQYIDTYAINSDLSGSYDGSIGLYPTRLYNPDFSWEINKKLEFAFNLSLFSNKIDIELAWYRNRSSNQLVGKQLPLITGFNSVQANLNATVQNKGLEIDLKTNWLNHKNWQWQSIFNISFERNKLLSFPNLNESSYSNQYVIGQPIDIQKMYHYLGVNPTTGIYEFKDYNQDGKLNSPYDKQSIQDLTPAYYGGITNTISYKNWSLNTLIIFSKKKAINYSLTNVAPGAMMNQPLIVQNNFDHNSHTDFQKYTTGINQEAVEAYYNYFTSSDYLVQNSSYIRLKTIELSYQIPLFYKKNMSGRINFQAHNLFTITPFKGIDPETNLFNYLPPIKSFYLGFQVNF